MKIERVVLATDFSPPAEAALDHAVAIAARFGAKLYIFHVVDVRNGESAPVVSDETCVDAFYELAEKRAREAGGVPIPIVECVRIGRPAEEVVAFADEKGADLIVVGTHGRSGLRRVFEGSVAESVVRRAPCPVLAIRFANGNGTPRTSFDRVVVAVDHSESSRAALRAAAELGARFGSSVVAVNVQDVEGPLAHAGPLVAVESAALTARLVEEGRSGLDRFVRETLGGEAASVKRVLELGRPVDAILRVAEAEKAGLIACGTHGRSGITRAIFGSVAEALLRAAPCPVLTVREGRAASRLAA